MIESLIAAVLVGGGLASALVVLVAVLKSFLYICKPNEILIFSGRQYQLEDGSSMGYRIVTGGRALRIPLFETIERMDLTTIPIDVSINNAYSKGGIPLKVHAIANVKVSSNPQIVTNAVERFLGRDPAEIKRVAKETLEGHLRGVLANLTPEEVNEDRLKFANTIREDVTEDFDRLGLHLDTLKVQSVSDDVEYLDSIGREQIANVLRDAAIAESNAKAMAEEEEADATATGSVAEERAEMAIRQRANQMRKLVAELEAKARSEEERAEQQALAARSREEQKLQQIRAKLEHLRLMADRVLPADAERKASEMRSRSEAAHIAADGAAMAEVLRMMTETWIKAGDNAGDIFLLQQIENVLGVVVERVQALELGEVTLLDSGDGRAIPQHVAAMPATVSAVLREFREATGLDIANILSGESHSSKALEVRE